MGLIEKRGTTDGTGSNYHCVITLWNEMDAKEYNNIYAYSAWSGWKITSTNIEYDELKTSVSNGKSAVASAITDKGISTSATATFDTMASNIRSIPTGTDTSDATATAAQILSGYTAYAKGVKLTGTASTGYTKVSNVNSSVSVGAGGDFMASFDSFKNGLIRIYCSGRAPFGDQIYGYIEIKLA